MLAVAELELLVQGAQFGHEGPVGQLHTLGRPGGAGGVDDREQIVAASCIEPGIDARDHRLGHGLVAGREVFQTRDLQLGAGVEGDHPAQTRHLVGHQGHALGLIGASGKGEHHAAVRGNVHHLVNGVGGIDGHGHCADELAGQINLCPFGAVA